MLYLLGNALGWFEGFILDPVNFNEEPLWMNLYLEFILELCVNFSPHNPMGNAEMQLENLQMGDGQHIQKYIIEFNRLSRETGWGECTLCCHFYNGLPDCLQDQLCRLPNSKPKTLLDMRWCAQNFDANHWERKAKLVHCPKTPSSKLSTLSKPANKPQHNNSASLSTPSSACRNSLASTPNPSKPALSSSGNSLASAAISKHLGNNGKLTPMECACCLAENLCLYCAKPGHQSKDCQRKQQQQMQAKACAATAASTNCSKELK